MKAGDIITDDSGRKWLVECFQTRKPEAVRGDIVLQQLAESFNNQLVETIHVPVVAAKLKLLHEQAEEALQARFDEGRMIWVRLFNHRTGGPHFAERLFVPRGWGLQMDGTKLRNGIDVYTIPTGGRMEIGA